jgi:YD repeat-containing protein
MEEHTYANGAAIRYRYDGLGRLLATIQPGDTLDLPTVRYTPNHTAIPTSMKTESRKASGVADTYDEVVYFDGQGREIQRRTRIEADRVRVSGITHLNRRGDPVFKGQPQFGIGLDYQAPETLPDTPGSRYEYDAVGRLVSAFTPENRECRVAYTPWTSIISDVIAIPTSPTPAAIHHAFRSSTASAGSLA